MIDRDLEVQKLLRLEVASKGSQSAVAFAVFSIFIFFYHFGCVEYEGVIKLTSIIIIILSVIRLAISKKVKKNNFMSSRDWKIIVFLVWANVIGWSVIFNLASFEHKLAGFHFIVATTMLTGFIASSLVTLAYDPILFIPFQFILLLPQLFVITYLYFIPERVDSIALLIPYSMYLLYQFKQYKEFRDQLIQRFGYQIDLEQSNLKLLKSQTALIDQTTKLVHTSRLAALGEMSAGIAHEVNNPLAIISGSMQQIEKMVNRGEVEKEQFLKLTHKSQQSIERVTKIIKGLKQFSQQSDTLPKVIVPLSDIINDTTNFCSEMLVARYIKLNIEEIPQIMIECQPVQISQVLINLIKNAEDSVLGEQLDADKWIKINFQIEKKLIYINVSNSGSRIPEEIHSKLFQPFFTTKVVGKGTGLGLSISHGIMKEHNGDLFFASENPFTTFSLVLPIK